MLLKFLSNVYFTYELCQLQRLYLLIYFVFSRRRIFAVSAVPESISTVCNSIPLTSEILVGDAPTCYKLSATASAELSGISSAHHWVKVTITHWTDIPSRRTGRRGVGPRDILNDSIISGSAVSGSTHESVSSR